MLIAQLSDIHVRPDGQLYKGVIDSNRMFSEAIEHLHQLDQRPDLLLISGDLVDEGSPQEYANLANLLRTLKIPYLVMPGNHDRREYFLTAFPGHSYLPRNGPLNYCVDDYAVRIIALDTCPPGKHHGEMDASSLVWLQNTLADNALKPTLIFMHHPPFMSGIPYLDDYRFMDNAPLEAVISASRNVHAVLCGHVHRTMFRSWANTIVAACPSTTTQISLQLQTGAKPQSFEGPAACLLHLWNASQGLISHVSFIGKYPGPFPFF